MQPPAKPPFSVRTAAMLLVVCTAALAELPVVPASLNATEYLFAEVDVDDEKLQAEVDFVGISVSVIDYGERNVDALAADVTEASSPASSSVSSSVSSSISSTMAATSTSRKPDTCQGNVWLARCSTIAVCLWRQRCEVSSDCSSHHDCGSDGFCQCKFVFKSGFQCYGNTLCAIKAFKKCDDDLLCAVTPTDDYLSTAMSLSLAFGACFIGMGAALLACKAWFSRRWNVNPGGRAVRGDGDSESISSMQRWINERLRDRPPRYEDMNSVATFGDAGSARSAGISAVTGSAALAEEKPPSYETALSESEIASFYGQPVTSDCPPPPYAEDLGMSFSNPCFLEDVPHELGQPTPPSTGVTVSPTSSMTSLSTLASSTSASQRPSGLLTLSEVVALQEMVMAEEAVSNKVVRTDADRS